MSAASVTTLALLAASAALLGGCSSLGGNVGGDFACRAPEGSCAPTSLIDAAATGAPMGSADDAAISGAPGEGARAPAGLPGSSADGRGLRIVLAARRDAAGREHEARVVHVALPEPAGRDWRQPSSTGDLLRAIGRAVAPPDAVDTADAADPHYPFTPLPDQMFLPSPSGSATLGADAPEGGAPGSSPLPGRVPQSLFETETNAPQGDEQ